MIIYIKIKSEKSKSILSMFMKWELHYFLNILSLISYLKNCNKEYNIIFILTIYSNNNKSIIRSILYQNIYADMTEHLEKIYRSKYNILLWFHEVATYNNNNKKVL